MYIEIDPTNYYVDTLNIHEEMIADSLGLLPSIFSTACEELEESGDFSDDAVRTALANAYGFPTHWSTGGKLLEDSRWQYPGDPVLVPLGKVDITPGHTLYVYRYGLVVLQNISTEETVYARMD